MSMTAGPISPAPSALHQTWRPIARYATAAVLAAVAGALIWFGMADASVTIRSSLIVFLLAILGWTVLRLPATPVALGAGLVLVLIGAAPDTAFHAALGHDLMWLLVAAFIIAAALRRTGLAERLSLAGMARARTITQLFYAAAAIITATAFVVPSTSGRAALLLPVYLALAGTIADRRLTRALALLFPTVILLSACASLIGAGAHLIAVDFMAKLGMEPISFARWMLLGAPFAVASSWLATWLILRLFLTAEERGRKLALLETERGPLTPKQMYVAAVASVTVALWLAQPWHGLGLSTVALIGALAATVSPMSGVTLKDAIKDTEWNLLIFLAATLMLGQTLIDTGAARYVADLVLTAATGSVSFTPTTVAAFAAGVSLLAHLVITSRTARVMVLVPSIAVPLSALGVNPAALIFLVTVGSGFCQTLAVSAKPVALYRALEQPTYDDRDLLRLSFWLLPLMAALLMLFALWIWPMSGLALSA